MSRTEQFRLDTIAADRRRGHPSVHGPERFRHEFHAAGRTIREPYPDIAAEIHVVASAS